MYFELCSDGIQMEYYGTEDLLTIEYEEAFLKVRGYDIVNLTVIVSNVLPNITVKSFVMESITLSQDNTGLYINNCLFIDNDHIEKLRIMINQAYNIRNNLMTKKKVVSSGSSIGATNSD